MDPRDALREGRYHEAATGAEGLDPDEAAEICQALIAAAETRPLDVPPAADGAAFAAERLARSLLERRDGAAARRRLANALRLLGPPRDDEAVAAFADAVAAAPDDAATHYDLGLLHKQRGRFGEALAATRRARELGLRHRGVDFNEAIAATAVGDGQAAVDRWRALGMDARVNAAGMPVVDGLPPAQVRVPAAGAGYGGEARVPDRAAGLELVSVAPISPCHGVLSTPTFRDGPVDYGDVVLWDAAPADVAQIDGVSVPRFVLLAVLGRGDERRLRFVALCQRPEALDDLRARLPDGCSVFVHRERVESVCSRCAAGELLTRHVHEPPVEHRVVYGKLIADAEVALPALQSALAAAMAERGELQMAVPGLYELLGDARRAGQEHQAFRGIERVGMRR